MNTVNLNKKLQIQRLVNFFFVILNKKNIFTILFILKFLNLVPLFVVFLLSKIIHYGFLPRIYPKRRVFNAL